MIHSAQHLLDMGRNVQIAHVHGSYVLDQQAKVPHLLAAIAACAEMLTYATSTFGGKIRIHEAGKCVLG
jgi:hypothetical protein